MQRSIGAAPAFLAADPAALMRGFHPFEIGQHIGERPAIRTLLGPVVEVARMPAHKHHAVDRGRSADHLATRCREPAIVEIWLGLGGVAPVIMAHVHRVGERRRHLDERAEIRAAMFDDDHRMLAVLAQP